jgi:2-polyprenyl-6-methoxyphenol hydroxylase-like FAD-dependent oxidoreductase
VGRWAKRDDPTGYVIGADGYDSAVRRMAGIEMAEHGGGQVFSIYEIEATGNFPPKCVSFSIPI